MNADGTPLMSFGLMGGPMQAQGHLQMTKRILRYRQNPHAAADAPRWRIEAGLKVAEERSFDLLMIEELHAKGHEMDIEAPSGVFALGGVQIIQRTAQGTWVDRFEKGWAGGGVLRQPATSQTDARTVGVSLLAKT